MKDELEGEGPDPKSTGVFALGLGALAACLYALATADPGPAPPGPVAVWAADRDASRVFGLDQDLLLARRIPVDWPLDVATASDGGLWVLRSGSGTASSTHRLDRFTAHGALVTELWIERALDLDVLAGGEQALLVEARQAAPARLVRVRTEGSVFTILERDGIACALGERAHAVAGTADGAVVRVDVATGAILATVQLGAGVLDLAAGPEPGTVWALDATGHGRLSLLGTDLAPRWSVPLPRVASKLAPVAGAERVWLACTQAPCVLRYGPGGALELDRCGLPLPGLERALAWRDGGALLTAVGAILHVGRDGGLRPGQGGFDYLVDLAASAP